MRCALQVATHSEVAVLRPKLERIDYSWLHFQRQKCMTTKIQKLEEQSWQDEIKTTNVQKRQDVTMTVPTQPSWGHPSTAHPCLGWPKVVSHSPQNRQRSHLGWGCWLPQKRQVVVIHTNEQWSMSIDTSRLGWLTVAGSVPSMNGTLQKGIVAPSSRSWFVRCETAIKIGAWIRGMRASIAGINHAGVISRKIDT